MNLKQRVEQISVGILAMYGTHIVATETGGDKTQSLFWLIYFLMSFGPYTIIISNWILPKRTKKSKHADNNRKIFEERME